MDHYIDQAPCLYFSVTDDGTLYDVNDTLCADLGYTRSALMGMHVDRIYTVATRIFQQTHFYPLLKMQGHAEEIYITLRTKEDAELPVLLNASRRTVHGTVLNVYAGIVVKNRKRFEEELIAARKEAELALKENRALQEAQKALQEQTESLEQQFRLVNSQHEELQQFSRVATHELQEPLRKLTLFKGMLEDEALPSHSHKIITKISQALLQMGNILSGLQQYVWLMQKQLKREVVDLRELLTHVLEQLKVDYPTIALEVEMGQLHRFEADKAQMEVLFYQLLSNVFRFRKPGEPVRVSIVSQELQLNKFQYVARKYQYEPYLRITIQDAGLGFDNTYKQQVFALFRRLHKESGRGVGLSLSKKIVDHHQGSISIDSQVDVGTTVTVLLPLTGKNEADNSSNTPLSAGITSEKNDYEQTDLDN